ncbi:MAG: haloacid dehalogenase [Deltaproteobacteria bacterium]|nr:haloacid dehalogenase [Deltaproteobacteria bacterium]
MNTPTTLGKAKIAANEVAFDIDGVIADTFRAFILAARKHYGSRLTYDDITDYDFRNVIDFDEHSANEIVEMILENPLQVGIRPMKGAVEVLTRLASLNPICFVTARTNREAIVEWIHEAVGLKGSDVMTLEATGNHREKLPVLIKQGVKYFVEDRLETCFLLHEAMITPIVFDQPWNRDPHPFHRVKSWEEIADLIDWDPLCQ